MEPASDPAGRGEQANPLLPDVVTSFTGAVSGEVSFGPSLNSPWRIPRLSPLTRTAWYSRGLFAEAPTVSALGATPGVSRLFLVMERSPILPPFPAAATTRVPIRVADSTACEYTSQGPPHFVGS